MPREFARPDAFDGRMTDAAYSITLPGCLAVGNADCMGPPVQPATPPIHQPRTMFVSMTLRAPSRSVPVACMYSRTACSLSPWAFARQSRAVEHTSPFP